MQLTDKERIFVAKRAKFVQTWPLAGGVLICLVLGLGVWLFWSKPLLANPFVVLSKLKNDAIPISTLSTMAGLLPISVCMCLVLTIAVVFYGFAAFANEKKHITIIKRMIEPANTAKRGEPEEIEAAQNDQRN
jgi:hypothetical protein